MRRVIKCSHICIKYYKNFNFQILFSLIKEIMLYINSVEILTYHKLSLVNSWYLYFPFECTYYMSSIVERTRIGVFCMVCVFLITYQRPTHCSLRLALCLTIMYYSTPIPFTTSNIGSLNCLPKQEKITPPHERC